MYTAQRGRQIYEFQRRAYDYIKITVPRGERDTWHAAADAAGLSMAEFVRSAVREKITESDKARI